MSEPDGMLKGWNSSVRTTSGDQQRLDDDLHGLPEAAFLLLDFCHVRLVHDASIHPAWPPPPSRTGGLVARPLSAQRRSGYTVSTASAIGRASMTTKAWARGGSSVSDTWTIAS